MQHATTARTIHLRPHDFPRGYWGKRIHEGPDHIATVVLCNDTGRYVVGCISEELRRAFTTPPGGFRSADAAVRAVADTIGATVVSALGERAEAVAS
ncbi:MAG: hypothetical protein VW405_02630 [Rhodospirillaceae bacterium]